MNNNSWNKKEKPLQALAGLGGGLAQPHVYSHKFSATGGTMVTPGNGSTYHIFASNGSFVVEGSGTVEFLVIAVVDQVIIPLVVEELVVFFIIQEGSLLLDLTLQVLVLDHITLTVKVETLTFTLLGKPIKQMVAVVLL